MILDKLKKHKLEPNQVFVYHSHNSNYIEYFDDDYLPITRRFSNSNDDFGIGFYLNENLSKAILYAFKKLNPTPGSVSYLKIYKVNSGDLPEAMDVEKWNNVVNYHRHSHSRDTENIQAASIVRGAMARYDRISGTYTIRDDHLQLRIYCVEFESKFAFVDEITFERK